MPINCAMVGTQATGAGEVGTALPPPPPADAPRRAVLDHAAVDLIGALSAQMAALRRQVQDVNTQADRRFQSLETAAPPSRQTLFQPASAGELPATLRSDLLALEDKMREEVGTRVADIQARMGRMEQSFDEVIALVCERVRALEIASAERELAASPVPAGW